MFFDKNRFPFTAQLEAQWPQFYQEYQELLNEELNDWPETQIYSGRWQVYGLYWQRQLLLEKAIFCPNSCTLIKPIPGLVNAGFSRLAPGCHIHPHTGYTSEVIRVHLALTQNQDCALRVGEQVRHWQQGQCLVFDDTQEHEAWNKGSSERVVLLLDVERQAYLQQPNLPPSYPHSAEQAN